jgi:ankyrin repeat protein
MNTDKADIFTIAQYGNYDGFIKKFVIEEINKKSKYGSSLLHYAIAGRNFDIALFLLEHGIDVNMTGTDGQPALHYLGVYPDLNVIKTILSKEVNINIRDKYGNNALWVAVFNCKGRVYEVVELLMQFKPDVLTKNNAGRSPLDFAKQIGDEKLVKIIEHDVN